MSNENSQSINNDHINVDTSVENNGLNDGKVDSSPTKSSEEAKYWPCPYCQDYDNKNKTVRGVEAHVRQKHPDKLGDWQDEYKPSLTGKKRTVESGVKTFGLATTPKVDAPLTPADEDEVKDATTEAIVAQAIERKFKSLGKARKAKDEFERPIREADEERRQQGDSAVAVMLQELSATNRMLIKQMTSGEQKPSIDPVMVKLLDKIGDLKAGLADQRAEFYKVQLDAQNNRIQHLEQNQGVKREVWERIADVVERQVDVEFNQMRMEDEVAAQMQSSQGMIQAGGVSQYVNPDNIDDED